MNAAAHEIKAHLGPRPRTATDLAECAGLSLEDTYAALVTLYDRGEAHMAHDKSSDSRKIEGWTE